MKLLASALRSAILIPAIALCALPVEGQNDFASPQIQKIQNGMQLTLDGQTVKAQFYAERTVRIVKWPAAGKADKLSLTVIQKELPSLDVHVAETATAVTLSDGLVKLVISKADGSIQYLDKDGKTILQEQGKAIFTAATNPREEKAFNLQQNFKLSADEGIYGLGQFQDGIMNYRGHTMKLVQSNTVDVTPVLVSTAGYGILWDNYSKTIFDDSGNATSLWSEVGDNIDYYFFYGPSIDQEIAGYRKLTGDAPLYGKWAYGYWQSKEHYATRDELLGIASEYRKRQIPDR